MQSTDETYQRIIGSENHWFVSRVVIGGVYYTEDKIIEMKTSFSMFDDSPTVGNAIAGEIEITMLRPNVSIPKMASIRPQIRVRNASEYSDWIPQGTYFIDTREYTINEDGVDILKIHGFDAMLKAEKLYSGRITGSSTDKQMVAEIAYQMGVSVDSRTNTRMNKSYTIPLPTSYTYREVLGYIAAMYVGNFIITDENKLRLVTLTELPEETNLLIRETGERIQTWDEYGAEIHIKI